MVSVQTAEACEFRVQAFFHSRQDDNKAHFIVYTQIP